MAPGAITAQDAEAVRQDAPAESSTEAAAPSLQPRYRMETSMGAILLELDAEKAPVSVLNFDRYVTTDYYDGTTFHRVIQGFMIQGGGYDSAYNKKEQGLQPPIRNEWRNGLKNARGTIAMARIGGRANSATSQFFINVVDNAGLDVPTDGSAYAVFGKVIEGMDIADNIAKVEKKRHPAFPSANPEVPKDPILIKDVKVLVPLDREKAEALVEKKVVTETKDAPAISAATPEEFVAKIEEQYGGKSEKTASGLVILKTANGSGEPPSVANNVIVSYVARLLDGKELDRQRDVELRLSNDWFHLQGLKEALQTMRKGDKAILFLPAPLAYGDKGVGSKVPPNTPLVLEVELKDIK